jgi:hypothetical protein
MAISHLGPTGVLPLNLQKLDAQQQQDLARWIQGWGLKHVDAPAFVDEVAQAVWLYPSLRGLAEQSSPGVVRENLAVAAVHAERLIASLNSLDGKSLFYLAVHTHGRSLNKEAAEILLALYQVRERVQEIPAPGRRAMPERLQFASLLLRALRRHTSAVPTSTPREVFERLLCYAFGLAGEKRKALHNLAVRALAANLQTEGEGGNFYVPSPK